MTVDNPEFTGANLRGEAAESDLVDLSRPGWLGTRPDGLPSQLSDDIWYLADPLQGADRSTLTINWNGNGNGSRPGRGGSRLRYWKDLAKRAAYAAMVSDRVRISRTSTLAVYAREIRAVCEWLAIERKCQSAESVTSADVNAYEEKVKALNITTNSATTKLLSFKYLWVLREEIGDGLLFDPYMQPGSIGKRARLVSVKNGHTPTLEPRELFGLLDRALLAVKESSDLVSRLDRYIEIRKKWSTRSASRVYAREFGHASKKLYHDLRLTYGAAIVILFALLGDRKHELASKKTGDVLALLDGDVEELVGSVRKTSATSTGAETTRPATREVKDALNFIVEVTKETRKRYHGQYLLLALPFWNSANNLDPGLELATNRIYRLVQIVADDAGVDRTIRPHMFRRAFAMLWVWRFELGDVQSLSRLLYHNDLVFTRYYTEDEDVWHFLPEAERAYAFEVMEAAVIGNRPIVGGVSKALRRYSAMIQSRVSVMSPETVPYFVNALLDRHGYRVVPQIDGYCMMSTKRGARARCSTDGKMPNYANRSEERCVGCANFGVTTKSRRVWEARKIAHQRVHDSTEIPILRSASATAVERAERVIAWIDQEGIKP